jgi:hypothetical protein
MPPNKCPLTNELLNITLNVGVLTILCGFTIGVKNQNSLNQNLCQLVQNAPSGAVSLRWILRDDHHHHHPGRMRLPERPVCLELDWRPTADESAWFAGVFRLNPGFPRFASQDNVVDLRWSRIYP